MDKAQIIYSNIFFALSISGFSFLFHLSLGNPLLNVHITHS